MKIISRNAAKEAGLKKYFTGKPCKNGHISPRFVSNKACSDCANKRSKSWRAENKSAISNYNKCRYEENKGYYMEKAKTWQQENMLKSRAIKLQWVALNQDSVHEMRKSWRLSNKHVIQHHRARRRIIEMDRALHGFNADIKAIYKKAKSIREQGDDVHVDHIVPLQGKNVSGLHVPWNLEIIPAKENLSKSNKFQQEKFKN